MNCVSGMIYTESGFIEGHICFEEGIVTEVCEGPAERSDLQGLILPAFTNAHTHIADYIVPVNLNLSLEELVAPPNGFKHRMLNEAPEAKLRQGIATMSEYMFKHGTTSFIDFREGSVPGAKLLSSAEWSQPTIMGKPSSFAEEELSALLKVSDGFGPSAISDWDYDDLTELARLARAHGKLFGIHCSERVREDIGKVLDLKPSFVVHMTKATREDLEACVEEKVPIVSCPRSNMFFGSEPPLKEMLDVGATVALGTDNAMISMPDLLCEAEFAARILRKQGAVKLDEVVQMIASNGRKIINHKQKIWIKPRDRCNFTVIENKNGDPVTDLVLRNAGAAPLMVCSGKTIWRRERNEPVQ
ncbi:amidohydrolase family protein [Candidatus Methanomassiliicoccus intestinalis]|uniref:amidohydrolase family protein n=1 Tax=Candidatus Methanomassiliicoccus intestinalis TaxID=1406512 RepID=UPI0037DC38D6